jgi:hypothetical protein
MNLGICSKEFFSYYMFHPLSEDLSIVDKIKACVASIFIGIFTLGTVHLYCFYKFRNQSFTLNCRFSQTAQKKQDFASNISDTAPVKAWTFNELFTAQLPAAELFNYATNWQDANESHQLMTKAAEMGHVDAMYEVGRNFELGKSCGNTQFYPNLYEAINWYRKAAGCKNAKACQALTNIYLKEKKLTLAVKYCRLAFEYGGSIFINNDSFSIYYTNQDEALKKVSVHGGGGLPTNL